MAARQKGGTEEEEEEEEGLEDSYDAALQAEELGEDWEPPLSQLALQARWHSAPDAY